MHVFLYEWITGGGLVEQPGRLPASLLAEGSAMISALAADFAAIDGCRVTVLRDMRLDELPLRRLRGRRDRIDAALARGVRPPGRRGRPHDGRGAGVRRHPARHVCAASATPAAGRSTPPTSSSPSPSTSSARPSGLHAAGVPAPEARHARGRRDRSCRRISAIPRCSSRSTAPARSTRCWSPARATSRRRIPGRGGWSDSMPGRAGERRGACAVPRAARMLPPCWQTSVGRRSIRLSRRRHHWRAGAGRAGDGARVAARSTRCRRRWATWASTWCWATTPTAREDVVIEINPRLTTSYVGLRRGGEAEPGASDARRRRWARGGADRRRRCPSNSPPTAPCGIGTHRQGARCP